MGNRFGVGRSSRVGTRDPLADAGPLIRRVYAYVAYRIGNGPAAEDVTSRAFERAVRYRASYDPEKGTPLTWLIAIANRCLADEAAAPVELAEPEDRPAPGNLEDDLLARVELARALATLDDRARMLIALRYGADMTARQIGELLDLSPHAVQVALGRALDRLERSLAPLTAI